MIRAATDLPDLEPEIVWTGSWEIAARLADRFRSGRVFLVGDAAKVTPPTGGQGGNTAVGDGADIAWKLAAVLRGDAGPALLDTYEAERQADRADDHRHLAAQHEAAHAPRTSTSPGSPSRRTC